MDLDMADFTAQDLHGLRADIGELKAAVRDVTKALERLARLEEKHSNASDAIERSFNELAKLDLRVFETERRIGAIETAMAAAVPETRRTSEWVDRAVWAVVAAAAMYIAKKVGLVV